MRRLRRALRRERHCGRHRIEKRKRERGAKAAQHKTVGLLHHKLAGQGVYVGEVVVLGAVKGTAFDAGAATIEASAVADRFWGLYDSRAEASVIVA